MDKCNIDNCNIYRAQYYLKHKWVPIIIYVMQDEDITFSYLLNKIEHISNKRLSEALKLLQEHNIIYKSDNYFLLTAAGDKLLEIILLMTSFENDFNLNSKNHF